jgi:hypothetical protein
VGLSAEQAADPAYEGLLVTISSGLVSDAAYECVPACSDPGLYEIGGPAGILVDPLIYADADWDTRRGTPPPITGVMSYRWERPLLFPRGAGDM